MIAGKQARETGTGIVTLRAQNGKMASSSKGKREVLVEHYRKLRTPTTSTTFDAEFREGYQRLGRGERRCIRTGRQVVQKGYRESSQENK